ncbi:hypothetical protein DL96DRAFT_1631302 [Flagelloscypha sp. PMI_526]|nr:hypothetical protein DL96DRAFT_1631302 [Flagelloscypha sp. PMI_526]
MPSQSLPLELTREIFEHAVLFNREDRYSLSLVARSVQRWTDPYAFQTIVITTRDHTESLLEMFSWPDKSLRLTRILSFVRTLASNYYNYHHRLHWDQLVHHFPGLVVLYLRDSSKDFVEDVGDVTVFQPPSLHNLRRIGGGYGSRTLRGSWACAQDITHLDLTSLSCDEWAACENRGISQLSRLKYLSFDLNYSESLEEIQDHLQRLPPMFPPSLLLCLVVANPEPKEAAHLSRFAYELDDRMLLCGSFPPKSDAEWILKANLIHDFDEWNGNCQEDRTYWVRGLNMVTRRRNVTNSPSFLAFIHYSDHCF